MLLRVRVAGAAAVAAGSGYSRLGGIGAYSAALKELVLLPLQLPELFAK
jgi:ATP-dependent 26S proteasome regulatory subunit